MSDSIAEMSLELPGTKHWELSQTIRSDLLS